MIDLNSDYSNFDIAKLMDVHPKTITKYFDFVEKPRKLGAEISKIPESEFIEAIRYFGKSTTMQQLGY